MCAHFQQGLPRYTDIDPNTRKLAEEASCPRGLASYRKEYGRMG